MSVTSAGQTPNKDPKLVDRLTVLRMLDAALAAESYRFARQVALGWLAAFPGDLTVNFLLAKTFLSDGKKPQAISILERIHQLDPENIDTAVALARSYEDADAQKRIDAWSCAYALGGAVDSGIVLPDWARMLRIARQMLSDGNLEAAESQVYQVMALKPDVALAGVVHLRIVRARKERVVEVKFAEIYHERWSEALPFALSLAELQLEMGDEAKAVNLLHQCVANDAAGQVALHWWGQNHPYSPLWPERLETTMDLPIPADVAIRLGWNILPGERQVNEVPIVLGPQTQVEEPPTPQPVQQAPVIKPQTSIPPQTSSDGSEPEGKLLRRARPKSDVVREAEREFERLARKLKRPVFAKADGRYPVYVVLSTKNGLIKQYGGQTATVLEDEMKRLADAVSKRPGWGAIIYFPDDPVLTAKYGVKPVPANDPWKLKLSLVDLDHALAKKGARIGSVLLVGNNDIVPFHRLPNPTDDSDDVVLSDNPYGTLDANYFVPEWPVGRMPGEKGPDAGLLLQQLRQAVRYHSQGAIPGSRFSSVASLITVWSSLFSSLIGPRQAASLGYTASVWKQSSLEAFRPIGEARSLMASPPETSGTFDASKLTSSQLSYYNLHGLPDTNEWYGQRDQKDAPTGPDYPVALKTQDLVKNGHTPKVIFTEACYGGYVQEKSERESIALRFLAVGAPVFVGSTCTAYGSVGTPLIAADLLGYSYWKYLREGYNAGEALVQSKVALVREMTRRQGYLDGEDQKTLISFVLYGDPLVVIEAATSKQPKHYVRQQSYLRVKTASDQWEESLATVPDETLAQVKKAVEPYLPGLEKAEVRVLQQEMVQTETKAKGHKKQAPHPAQQTVVSFKKSIEVAQKTYFQFARVTLDGQGKMIKMAISR